MAFPSTFKDIQDGVIAKARLVDPDDRGKVKDWINRAYARVCVETEALQTSTTMNLTPNVAGYTLPTQILRIKQITAAPPGGGYGPPLDAVSLEQILIWRQTGTVSPVSNQTSTYYALVGKDQLELFPTPANADVLLVYYVYLPTPLAADGDVPVLQEPYVSDCLEYSALFEAAMFKNDPYAALDWQGLAEDSQAELIQHLTRRAKAGSTGQLRLGTDPPLYLRRDVDVPIGW